MNLREGISAKRKEIFIEILVFVNYNFVITVAPENPGLPHPASCPLISLESKLLVLAISSRYLFQSENESLGEFLEKETITMFEHSLKKVSLFIEKLFHQPTKLDFDKILHI